MYAANYDQYKRDMAAYKAGGKVDEDHDPAANQLQAPSLRPRPSPRLKLKLGPKSPPMSPPSHPMSRSPPLL